MITKEVEDSTRTETPLAAETAQATDLCCSQEATPQPKFSDTTIRPLVVITGCSGLIGSKLAERLAGQYEVVGVDIKPLPTEPSEHFTWMECDLTDDESVRGVFQAIQEQRGAVIASVVHLAAYYDFSGEPSSMYQQLTIDGTRRVLRELEAFQVDQFIFSSTLLVMQSAASGRRVDEESPLSAEWDYPQSKLATEKSIAEQHGEIPVVILRIAGVYDEDCHSIPIAQQIARIYEKQLESYFFPGNAAHGQSFIHLDDLLVCLERTVERRRQLDPYELLLIGEEDVMSYEELQEAIGELIHGTEWPTIRIPKAMAKAGAWVQEKIASKEEDEPFIKPWMIDLADQNYPVRIDRARKKLHWEPTHTLRNTLPAMTQRLQENPNRWYAENKLVRDGDNGQSG